jgi:hypothetical protein
MPTFAHLDDRELRRRIARLRRRIDGRLHAVERQGRKLLSWRTLVRRYPAYSAIAAAGAGLSLAAGLRKGRIVRWLGGRAARAAVTRLAGRLWQDMRQAWVRTAPLPSAPASAAGHPAARGLETGNGVPPAEARSPRPSPAAKGGPD